MFQMAFEDGVRCLIVFIPVICVLPNIMVLGNRNGGPQQIEDSAFEESGEMIWKKGLENVAPGSDLDVDLSSPYYFLTWELYDG